MGCFHNFGLVQIYSSCTVQCAHIFMHHSLIEPMHSLLCLPCLPFPSMITSITLFLLPAIRHTYMSKMPHFSFNYFLHQNCFYLTFFVNIVQFIVQCSREE